MIIRESPDKIQSWNQPTNEPEHNCLPKNFFEVENQHTSTTPSSESGSKQKLLQAQRDYMHALLNYFAVKKKKKKKKKISTYTSTLESIFPRKRT